MSSIFDFQNMQIKNIEENCNYYTSLENVDLLDSLSLIHMNVRSMKNKFDDICNFLAMGTEWDIVLISEIWVKSDLIQFYQLESYNLFATCRSIGEGGGTAIYVHKKHDCIERDDLKSNEIETTYVEIKLRIGTEIRSAVIGEIYRPPNYASTDFLDYMECVLEKVENEKKFCILAGDFNYNLLAQNRCVGSSKFMHTMASYGFLPLIAKETRIQKQSATLLDNIFINDLTKYNTSGIIINDLSDHLPIFASLKFKSVAKSKKENVKFFDKKQVAALNTFLSNELNGFETNTDANAASVQMTKAYMDGISKFSKTYKTSRRKTALKPWITPGILCSINRKSHLYKKFIKRGNARNEEKYKRYRNVLLKVTRDAKKLYFQKSFNEAKNNTKETWSLLSMLINKENKKNTDFPEKLIDNHGRECIKSEIPERFNIFFATIGEQLDKGIPVTDGNPLDYLQNYQNRDVWEVSEVTCGKIENIIRCLNKVGGGIDKISTYILSKIR